MDKLVCPCVTIKLWAINWVEAQNPKPFSALSASSAVNTYEKLMSPDNRKGIENYP